MLSEERSTLMYSGTLLLGDNKRGMMQMAFDRMLDIYQNGNIGASGEGFRIVGWLKGSHS